MVDRDRSGPAWWNSGCTGQRVPPGSGLQPAVRGSFPAQGQKEKEDALPFYLFPPPEKAGGEVHVAGIF